MPPSFHRAGGAFTWTVMGAGAVAAGAFLGTWVRRALAPDDGCLRLPKTADGRLLALEQRLEQVRTEWARKPELETLVGERLAPALAALEGRLDRQQADLDRWQAERRKTQGKLKRISTEVNALTRREPKPC